MSIHILKDKRVTRRRCAVIKNTRPRIKINTKLNQIKIKLEFNLNRGKGQIDTELGKFLDKSVN